MIKKNHFFLISSICFLTVGTAYAQKSLSEQIDVVRAYKPILADPVKMISNPEIEDSKSFKPEFNYDIPVKRFDSTEKSRDIAAQNMNTESIQKLFNTYLKAGGGNYGTFYGDLYSTNTRSRTMQYGFHAMHLSSSPSGDIKNRGYSDNRISVFGTKIFTDYKLYSDINYKRDGIHFYGDNDKVNESLIRQRYNKFDFNVQLESSKVLDTNNLQYGLQLKGYALQDLFSTTEQHINLSGSMIRKYSGLPVEISGMADLSDYFPAAGGKQSNNYFSASAWYRYEDSSALLHLGFKTGVEDGLHSRMHFYPHLTGQYHLIGRVLNIYGGLTGDLKKNTLNNFYTENPFIGKNLTIDNTNKKIDLFAGIRGNLTGFVGFRTNFSYQTLKNSYFFRNDTPSKTNFLVVYDAGTIGLMNFTQELSLQLSDKVRLNGQFDYYKYDMDKLPAAWYKPVYKFQFTGTYNIGNKFLVAADLFHFARRIYLDKNDSKPHLPGITDMNLSIDYRYSKIISVFLKLNNLTNATYQYWAGYPVYGLNVLAGVGFSF